MATGSSKKWWPAFSREIFLFRGLRLSFDKLSSLSSRAPFFQLGRAVLHTKKIDFLPRGPGGRSFALRLSCQFSDMTRTRSGILLWQPEAATTSSCFEKASPRCTIRAVGTLARESAEHTAVLLVLLASSSHTKIDKLDPARKIFKPTDRLGAKRRGGRIGKHT